MADRARGYKAQLDHYLKSVNAKHPAHARLVAGYVALGTAIENLENLHAARDTTETQAAHDKRVLQAAKKLKDKIKTESERLKEQTGAEAKRLQSEIDAKVKLHPNEFAKEIREQYRLLPQGEKIKFLKEHADANDGAVLAAILKAPKALTGNMPDMNNHFLEYTYSKHAPDEWTELAAIASFYSGQDDFIRTANNAADAYSDPGRLAEITRQEETARQARAAFDASTGVTT